MTGKLYGIGVGPGDPELLTLKAVRLIRDCEILAVPGTIKEETTAYRIVYQVLPEIAKKECLALNMPMTKDRKLLESSHKIAFELLRQSLDQGKDVAFLTLGDPCIYSTYIYMHQRAVQAGYQTEIISGIPSFCAVSAKLNQGLVEKSQMLHIIPSTYDMEQGLKLSGTKVLMKVGRKLQQVKEQLQTESSSGEQFQVAMIENCGMPEEQIYQDMQEIPDQAGYYTLMIVKEQGI